MSLVLEKETIDYILSQDYNWKSNVAIPETFTFKDQMGRISDYSVIKDNRLHNKIMSFFEHENKSYNYNLDGRCSIKLQRYKN